MTHKQPAETMTPDVAKIILREKLATWERTRSISLASEICEMLLDNNLI